MMKEKIRAALFGIFNADATESRKESFDALMVVLEEASKFGEAWDIHYAYAKLEKLLNEE